MTTSKNHKFTAFTVSKWSLPIEHTCNSFTEASTCHSNLISIAGHIALIQDDKSCEFFAIIHTQDLGYLLFRNQGIFLNVK